MSIRLGYQIPNFSYPGGAAAIAPTVVAQAREAEAAGFDAVFVMDHLYQLPGIGTPDQPMLEAYTLLGALASATSRVQLSALVTGNTYRNPALLAKAVTTLDVVSGGRAVLGIGAGWFELEHTQLGFEFGTFTERFDRLDEALSIIEPMLRGRRPTVSGRWYRTEEAMNEPRLRDDLPILIGGSGERKTFRIAAQHAAHLNMICDDTAIPAKLDALALRCQEQGRDRAEMETSYLAFLFIAETDEQAWAGYRDFGAARGVDIDALTGDQRSAFMARHVVGGPDSVAEQVQRRILDPGIDGIIVNMMGNGHVPGMVTLAAETLRPLVG